VSVDYAGEFFVIGGILLTGVLGWIGTIIAKRVRTPTPIDKLWQRLDAQDARIMIMEGKLDTAERRAGASVRIIRDLARQWPNQNIPRLNPSDIDILEDTIPDHWKVKPFK
jgi:hypothetical protein